MFAMWRKCYCPISKMNGAIINTDFWPIKLIRNNLCFLVIRIALGAHNGFVVFHFKQITFMHQFLYALKLNPLKLKLYYPCFFSPIEIFFKCNRQ